MEVFEGYRALFRPLSAPAVALGNFDGVHRGHQALIEAAVQDAAARDADSVVYTFEPHPAKVLAPELAPAQITTLDRKLELLSNMGVRVCVVEPFTRELAGMAPDDFLQTVLVDVLHAHHVVVGYDFTYGRKRSGSVDDLCAFANNHGFSAEVIDAVEVEGIVASSTKVRNFVTAGNLKGARLLLGRNFDVDGTVIKGDGRGKTIGVPTANIDCDAELLPAGGVYAVRSQRLDSDTAQTMLAGVANLGTNPTFTDASRLSLEVHLFDFEDDLYGERLRVSFVQRLRGERRFDSVDALVEQIHADAAAAKEILSDTDAT